MPSVLASSASVSSRMAKVRQSGTKAELELRRQLFHLGMRYRVNYEVLKRPRRVADVAFPGLKVAVFVDGCFWHGCPEHVTWPKHNADFWRKKIESNRSRDADTNVRLNEKGWTVIRIWEHESPSVAAKKIYSVISRARARAGAASSRTKSDKE